MTQRQFVLYNKDGKIGHLTLNRPEKLNALNDTVLDEIQSVLDEVDQDDDVSAVVIKGAGRAFCAGFDIGSTGQRHTRRRRTPAEGMTYHLSNLDGWRRRRNFTKPLIAQIHGYCVGGGTWLALSCDVLYVAENTTIAPIPLVRPLGSGGYGSQLWTWAVGSRKTKELVFVTGATIDGREAERIGWANRAVPADRLEAEVLAYTNKVVQTPMELLVLRKATINRAEDMAGLQQSLLGSSEIDVLAYFTNTVVASWDKIAERGVQAAKQDWYGSVKQNQK